MWRLSITSFFAVSQYPFLERSLESLIVDALNSQSCIRRSEFSSISARMIAALVNSIAVVPVCARIKTSSY